MEGTRGGRKWKNLKQRLRLKGLGCCGNSWGFGTPTQMHVKEDATTAAKEEETRRDVATEEEENREEDTNAKFLVEVKSGQAEASLNPDQELRRLKQLFEVWKKDYILRLRETKVILQKLGTDEANADKVRKKWSARRNSLRM